MRFLLVFVLSLFSINAMAQDAKAQGILDKLSTKMKGMKSFYIEFNASVKNSTTGTNENEIGKGWVKGNKYCASYGETTIISNGIKTWTVVKEDKSIYQTDVNQNDNDNLNPKKLMTIWETGFKNKYEKEKTDLVFDLRLTGESKSKILPLLKLLKELRSDDSIKIDGNEIFKTSLTLA